MITAEDVLTVLNDLEPVALEHLELAVAVEPATESWSNQLQRMVPGESWWPFERAEIVVVRRDTDREPFNQGRKPSKWSIRFEYFDDLDAAQGCRQRVLAPVSGSQESDGGGR